MDRANIALPGKHNLENILAAVAACILVGCDKGKMEEVLATFGGVRHRTQFVREWNGRKIYNDSKATNCLATKSALDAFQAPVILLAGGLDRGHSFEELRSSMNHVKASSHSEKLDYVLLNLQNHVVSNKQLSLKMWRTLYTMQHRCQQREILFYYLQHVQAGINMTALKYAEMFLLML